MSRLRLKETPLEREERIAKEQRRAARKARKREPGLHFDYQNDSEERQWRLSEPIIYRTRDDIGAAYDQASAAHAHEGGVNDDGSSGATSSKHARRTDYDHIQKELEEASFRAKLFDAMEDDEHLDTIEARFNSYRVPDRWNYDSKEGGDGRGARDPNHMDDEEYAEWIRRGMWEKRHRQEIDEEKRREQERTKKKSQEKRQREETRKLEEESRRRQQEIRARMMQQAFEAYNAAWSVLASESTLAPKNLQFRDIPWPVHPQPRSSDEITIDAISTFLFSSDHSPEKSRKQRMRDAIFLYHPDRFNKWAAKISNETERHMTLEAAGRIVRHLTSISE